MKTYYKIHLMYPAPLSHEVISELENYLSDNLRGRITVDNESNQIASLIVSSHLGNPEWDEISDLLLCLDETDWQPFFGYPKDDYSNAVTDDCGLEVWNLLDSCEVDEPTH